MGRRPLPASFVLASLLAGGAAAATLDVAASGDDLVFTWDTGVDDLLRGATPDDLRPWLTAVASPLVVPGENRLRGENAFYELASGSNMGFRIERTFEVPDPAAPKAWPTTLPERRSAVTAADLMAAWPTLVEVLWMDPVDGRLESLGRVGPLLLGDGGPLPPRGGVWLAFSETTILTLVGSHDDTSPGAVQADLAQPLWWFEGLLPIPPHVRARRTAFELLCGERGVDWEDANGDTVPDTCGRDLDMDGTYDTGLWAGDIDMSSVGLVKVGEPFPSAVIIQEFSGEQFVIGRGFGIGPGDAVEVQWAPDAAVLNLPFRPPTW